MIAHGKVERVGVRESLRIEENARRASTESPPRAKSAMTEFQEKTLFLSTYLLNNVVRFVFVECLSTLETTLETELDFESFICSSFGIYYVG